ncbi:PA0069 family radical SAM protein [Balneola sp. MJW-20]|uniref:PA0069 family radical SAM protein n=1 Tax=Gracilimonas aurantiaca TaxID=3234185 RepID=UPI0034679375
MINKKQPIKGRGSSDNPINRFEENYLDYDLDPETGEKPSEKTQFIKEDARSIITFNKSQDVPFEASINPYRGCEHGCIYCYARPYHEYLGYSAGLDFETRIMVKYNAPDLLRKELSSPRWQPQVIAMSGVTDIYQPVERKLELTRKCLQVLADFRNPVGVITKNHLITRDIDILGELADYHCIKVTVSITTLDRDLGRVMEPRTSSPQKRLEAIRKLSNAGIPVGVNIAPVIPGLTDHEMPAILEEAKKAGATSAGYIVLRLPFKVKDLFTEWLEDHYPQKKNKVLNRIRDVRGGKLNNTEWNKRMKGQGNFAAQIRNLFKVHTHRLGLNEKQHSLTTEHFIKSHGTQMNLF